MSKQNDKPEIKQTAIGAKRLRFRGGPAGSFRDARFGEDGVSEEPVSAETAKALREHFPEAEIEEIEDAPADK